MITINGYPIDVAVSEEHQFDSDVTDWPVEQGADITDNARARPIQVTINGIVSDTPIGDFVDLRASETAANSGGANIDPDGNKIRPSNDAFARLIAIRDAREPVTIQTSLQRFTNMMLISLSVPRDAKTGKSLRFRATFKQIRFVTNARTKVRVSVPRGQGKDGQGTRAPLPAGTVTKDVKTVVTAAGALEDAASAFQDGAWTDSLNASMNRQEAIGEAAQTGTTLGPVQSLDAPKDPCDAAALVNEKQGRDITDQQACQEIVLNGSQPLPWTAGSSNFDPTVNP